MSVDTKIGKIHMAQTAVHNKLGRIHLKKVRVVLDEQKTSHCFRLQEADTKSTPIKLSPNVQFSPRPLAFFCLKTYDIIVICKPHCIQLTLTVICYKQLAHVLYQAFQLCGG